MSGRFFPALSRGLNAVLLGLLPFFTAAVAVEFQIESFDVSTFTLQHASVSLNASPGGHPQIAFVEVANGLTRHQIGFLGVRASGSWERRRVVEYSGTRQAPTSVTLLLDETGRSYVGVEELGDFGRSGSSVVSVYRGPYSGTDWPQVFTDGAQDVRYKYPVFQLGPSGALHVAFVRTDDQLVRYATNQSGAWVAHLVSGSLADATSAWLGRQIALAIDSTGSPQIAWRDVNGHLRLSRREVDGLWRTERVSSLQSAFISLVLDSTDIPHLSFYSEDSTLSAFGKDLIYATRSGGAWVFEGVSVIGDTGRHGPYGRRLSVLPGHHDPSGSNGPARGP